MVTRKRSLTDRGENLDKKEGGGGGERRVKVKINRADRVVHLHAVRDECIAYAIPMQRPVAVPVSGRSPALLSARADPSERASEEESVAERKT